MRKLLILSVLIIFLTSGCAANNANITRSETQSTKALPTYEPSPLNTQIASGCEIPRSFENEEQLVAAIKGNMKAGLNAYQGDPDTLDGMEFYFVPENIPDGMTLAYINVKDFYLALSYMYDHEADPYVERTFIFEWYRTMGPGDIEADVRKNFSNMGVKKIENYYVMKVKPSGGYTGDNEYVCQEIFWEQDGFAFHVVLPSAFTFEDIQKYCVAKKVMVK